MKTTFLIGIFCTLLFGCTSQRQIGEDQKRDESFYSKVMNDEILAQTTNNNVDKLFVLEVGDEYPMRFAIYKNGTFYYQVDQLGDGSGNWTYRDGILELTAERKLFNVEFSILAENSSTDQIIVQFTDRFTFHSYNLKKYDNREGTSKTGEALSSQSNKETKSKLRQYKFSKINL